MMHDQIVGLTVFKRSLEIGQIVIDLAKIDCIHDGNFVVKNDIAVIGHAGRHFILTFKQINIDIVNTDIADGIGIHKHNLQL